MLAMILGGLCTSCWALNAVADVLSGGATWSLSPPSGFCPQTRYSTALCYLSVVQGKKHVPNMTNKKGDHESPQVTATSMPTQSSTQRVPPPETPEAVQTRFRVIAAFWAVIIFLGFPIWWKTTSIYRAHLPIQEMVDWAMARSRCNSTRWQSRTYWMANSRPCLDMSSGLSSGDSCCNAFYASV